MSEPKHPSCEKPVSSRTITTTFGAPVGGRGGGVNAGRDCAMVCPMRGRSFTGPFRSRRDPLDAGPPIAASGREMRECGAVEVSERDELDAHAQAAVTHLTRAGFRDPGDVPVEQLQDE